MKVSRLDHRIPPPHQKQGDAPFPWSLTMGSASSTRIRPRVRLSRTPPRAAALLVLLGAVALLASAPAQASSWSTNATYAWGNGVMTCVFNATSPTATVSAADRTGSGMGLGLTSVAEVTPGGAPVATATVGTVAWDPVNDTTAQWFEMNYTGSVAVMTTGSPVHSVGAVQLTFLFSLVRNVSAPGPAAQVLFSLTVSGWPWQSPSDLLTLTLPVWSAFPATEHIVLGSHGSPTVQSVSTANGQPLEYFQAGASANGTSGAPIPVTVVSVLSGGEAATTLTIGPGVGGASTLTYESTLGLPLATPVLGLPLYDYLAVAGGAGLVALAVGVGTRQIRRRPSDLTYVEESE